MKWLFSRKRIVAAPKPAAAERETPAIARLPFHAVEVVSSGPRCEAARAIEEQRFLSRDGPPTLPLAGCTRSANCVCRYRHHADRRNDHRRASDQAWGPLPRWPEDRERRRSGGRRATDGPPR